MAVAAITGPPLLLSPLDLARAILGAAREAIRRAVFDSRVRTLEALVVSMETETVEAFRGTDPRDLQKVAAELGRKHWRYWGDALRLALDLAELLEIHEEAIARHSGLVWRRAGEEADLWFARFSREAHLRLRATASLMAAALDQTPTPELREVAAIWQLAKNEVPEEAYAFTALLQAVAVAAATDTFSLELRDALASALWERVRSVFEPALGVDAVEDAYWAAASAEVEAAGEPSTSLDDFAQGKRA